MSYLSVPNATKADRILVVDDAPDNVLLVQTILEEEGYEISTAENGFSALSQIDKSAPDLVLLDVMMPGMDGYEVTKRIRQNKELPFIPILLITAHDSASVVQGLDMGADDFIRKPVAMAELLARGRSRRRRPGMGHGSGRFHPQTSRNGRAAGEGTIAPAAKTQRRRAQFDRPPARRFCLPTRSRLADAPRSSRSNDNFNAAGSFGRNFASDGRGFGDDGSQQQKPDRARKYAAGSLPLRSRRQIPKFRSRGLAPAYYRSS